MNRHYSKQVANTCHFSTWETEEDCHVEVSLCYKDPVTQREIGVTATSSQGLLGGKKPVLERMGMSG